MRPLTFLGLKVHLSREVPMPLIEGEELTEGAVVEEGVKEGAMERMTMKRRVKRK